MMAKDRGTVTRAVSVALALTLGACASSSSRGSSGTPRPSPTVRTLPVTSADPAPPPAGTSDEDRMFAKLASAVTETIATAAGRPDRLNCPPEPPVPVVELAAQARSGSLRPALTTCPAPTFSPPNSYAVRVQNTTGVPVRIGLGSVGSVRMLAPDAVVDLPLPDGLRNGQRLVWTYEIDPAGIAYTAAGKLVGELAPGGPAALDLAGCAVRPDLACLLDSLASVLPANVTFRGVRLPVATTVKVVGKLVEYAPLLKAWAAQSSGASAGTLTVTYRGFG